MGHLELEQLAYWYFRLNGCLTIPNFIVHPDRGRNQETDVDVIAIRFPFRSENFVQPMKDDPLICADRHRIRIMLAEVKTGTCSLNGPWTNESRRNMQRVLAAIGPFQRDILDEVASSMYRTGCWRDTHYFASLFCVGAERNPDIETRYPEVPQVIWDQVTQFIFDRFKHYKNQKVSHSQWDEMGKRLYDIAVRSHDSAEFKAKLFDR
ncbi:MAG: hypothetical protein AB7G75_26815 [Candidatus Binatia bacterium]